MVCPVCLTSLAWAVWQRERVLLAEEVEQQEHLREQQVLPVQVLLLDSHPLGARVLAVEPNLLVEQEVRSIPHPMRVEEEDPQEEQVARSIPHQMRVEEVGLREEQVARSIPHQMKVEEVGLREEQVARSIPQEMRVVEVGLQGEQVARSIPHQRKVVEEDLREEQVARSIPHQRQVVEEDLQVAGPSLLEERVSHQFLRRKWVEEVGLIQARELEELLPPLRALASSLPVGEKGRARQLMEHPQTRKRVGEEAMRIPLLQQVLH